MVCIILLPLETVYAEPVLITASGKVRDIEFDGKWTTETEWKPTSLNEINDPQTIIRSAHYEDYVYLMIDVPHDTSVNMHSDRAMVCFDTLNDKSENAQADDYCFQATVGSQNAVTLQGGSPILKNNGFKKISNHENLIAVGNVSDENDRYSDVPHASYEFKIPIEVIGRSDNYGFLVYVYDDNTKRVVTWPAIELDNNNIPPPAKWGDMISPDKSLPEFSSVYMIMVISILSVFVFKFKNQFVLKSN